MAESGERRTAKQQAVLLAGALVVALGLLASPFGGYLSHRTLDLLFVLRGPVAANPDVVVVAIDETSFADLGLQWPWPRRVHAALVDALHAAGARTIALDIVFAEPSDAENDDALARAIRAHGNVVLAGDVQTTTVAKHSQTMAIKPLPSLVAAGAAYGFATLPLDEDGTVRRVGARMADMRPFAYVAAARHQGRQCCGAGRAEAAALIDFAGPARSVRTVSYYQALDPETHLRDGFFRDKLVLVGLSVTSTVDVESYRSDYFPVPYSNLGAGYMSGVELHANIASNLLDGRLPVEIARPFSVAIGFLGSVLLFFVANRLSLTAAAVVLAATWASGAVAAYLLFVEAGRIVGYGDLVLTPSFVFAACWGDSYFRTLWQKRYIRGLFSTYLAPSIVEELERNPWQLDESGTECEATVMFLDIAGFTSLSEKLAPQELLHLLNRILSRVDQIVVAREGLIDKYIGDAVMAVWGAPLQRQGHAALACRAALQVRDAIEELNASGELVSPIDFRIGINTGPLVAGNVGGYQHRNYSFFGDNVNLASRLEGINNVYGTKITVSEATAVHLDAAFRLRELDLVVVKGKSEPVRIFELQEEAAVAATANGTFQEGLVHYRTGDWEAAIDKFKAFLEQDPEDGPSNLYVARCEYLAANPPAAPWDGVFRMTTK